MSLGEGNYERTTPRAEIISVLAKQEEHLSKWFEHPASDLVNHDDECCEKAKLWFLSLARSMEIGSSDSFKLKAPTWLSKHFKWGASEWPMAWCEVVAEDVIDCGMFAALSREVFNAQGHPAYPGQALLSYNESCTKHWKGLWDDTWKNQNSKTGRPFPWIGDRLVYHELCVLEMENGEGRFYDATHGTWYEPHQRYGFGALLAVRSECPRLLRWADKQIACGEWVNL